MATSNQQGALVRPNTIRQLELEQSITPSDMDEPLQKELSKYGQKDLVIASVVGVFAEIYPGM